MQELHDEILISHDQLYQDMNKSEDVKDWVKGISEKLQAKLRAVTNLCKNLKLPAADMKTWPSFHYLFAQLVHNNLRISNLV